MINSKSELYAALSESVINNTPVTQELLNDIMLFVFNTEIKHHNELNQGIENQGKLFRMLNDK